MQRAQKREETKSLIKRLSIISLIDDFVISDQLFAKQIISKISPHHINQRFNI